MSRSYYAVLERTIAAARQDPARLRALVYQLARLELKRALYRAETSITLASAKQQIGALESAIEQIETSVQQLPSQAAGSGEPVTVSDGAHALRVQDDTPDLPGRQVYRPDVLPPLGPPLAGNPWPNLLALEPQEQNVSRSKRGHRASWSTLQMVLVAIFAVAIFFGLQQGNYLINFAAPIFSAAQHNLAAARGMAGQRVKKPANTPLAMTRTQVASLPTPRAFGVYAMSAGRLTDLATLPFKVPDPRIGVSAMISHPAAVTLPNGHLDFIAFQRELIDNAPDRASVRVIARVMHALTFDATGHAKIADIAGPWAVRDKSYDMRVGPVSGHPDMISIRPADPNFTFPPGRYALVLGDTGYDFSVAGPISDPIQCLERTDAVNAPIYNECRTP